MVFNYQGDGDRKTQLPVGSINVVDPSPLNWLYVLFHTVEECVRTDHLGRVVPALATHLHWLDDTTLELHFREDVNFHNHEIFGLEHVVNAFYQSRRWVAPHPPGTSLNIDEDRIEKVDQNTIRVHFSKTDGLAPIKLRARHIPNMQFWRELGFGYMKLGTGEGHW